MIEQIKYGNLILGIIVRHEYCNDNITFFTPDTFSQQLGYMKHPEGYQIVPHVHNPVKREVEYTQEVLFIKSGCVQVDFYSDDRLYLESRILYQGDIVLLAHGGHGFKMLEQSELIEVKQGPYCGDMDKTRFDPENNKEQI